MECAFDLYLDMSCDCHRCFTMKVRRNVKQSRQLLERALKRADRASEMLTQVVEYSPGEGEVESELFRSPGLYGLLEITAVQALEASAVIDRAVALLKAAAEMLKDQHLDRRRSGE